MKCNKLGLKQFSTDYVPLERVDEIEAIQFVTIEI